MFESRCRGNSHSTQFFFLVPLSQNVGCMNFPDMACSTDEPEPRTSRIMKVINSSEGTYTSTGIFIGKSF